MYILFNNPHFNRTTVIKMVGKCVESIEEKKSVDGEKITPAQSLFKMLQNLDYDLQTLLQGVHYFEPGRKIGNKMAYQTR